MGGLLGKFNQGDIRSDLGAVNARNMKVVDKIGRYNTRIGIYMRKLSKLKKHSRSTIRNRAFDLERRLKKQQQKLGIKLREEMNKPLPGGDRIDRDEEDGNRDNVPDRPFTKIDRF